MKKTLVVLFAISVTQILDFADAQTDHIMHDYDAQTKPEYYFLEKVQIADSVALLPPPPAVDSIEFLADQSLYQKGKLLRDSLRGKQAENDVDISHGGITRAFSESFGFKLSEKTLPETFKLIMKVRADAGDLAVRDAKRHYMRIRPYVFYNEPTCFPAEEEENKRDGAYPSGHTSLGWAIALVLAEINPQRQNEILNRGYALGESRIICGYHWNSDVVAGRITGSSVVARLHADPDFMEQLQKAKNEFARLDRNDK